jgi:hypothetical protein
MIIKLAGPRRSPKTSALVNYETALRSMSSGRSARRVRTFKRFFLLLASFFIAFRPVKRAPSSQLLQVIISVDRFFSHRRHPISEPHAVGEDGKNL